MAGKITELDDSTFDKFLGTENVVVDFWAEWCGPCQMMMPIVSEAAKQLKDKVKFAKVNVDESPELAQRFQVMSIPTLILFKGKEQVDRIVGAVDTEEIIEAAERAF